MAITIEPTFLIVGALIFVAFLGFILRAASSSTPEKVEKPKVRKAKPTKKEKKPKKASFKKGRVDSEPTVWTVDDTNEEEEVLEFLKGKDADVIAKELAKSEKNKRRKNKTKQTAAKEQEAPTSRRQVPESSEDEEEGYVTVARKAAEEKEKEKEKKGKKGKKAEESEEEKKRKKPFFKPVRKTPEEIEAEKKQREEDRAAARLARRAEAEERRASQPEEKTSVDRPRHTFAEAEHISYETASVEDLLNSITKAYKPAAPLPRAPSIFSKLKRHQIMQILSFLEVRDLVALSRVNHHLSGLARSEALWERLARRDLNLQSKGSARTWRAAYRAAYRSPKAQ